MKFAQPQGLHRRSVEQLLSKAKEEHSVASRIDYLSRQLLGRRYQENPLIGSVDTAEIFTASLDGFDCVTYIETVVALACASTVGDFIEWLRKIRYDQGRIEWRRRNHYMTDWIRNNEREERIKPVSMPGTPTVSKKRSLNIVAGLAARQVQLECLPKTWARRIEPHLQTGDLIFFVSTRKTLDVFHAGIVVRGGAKLLLRHASRSQGGVVEQELGEFLKANRMSGVIVMRPHAAMRGSRPASGTTPRSGV